jgi:hypothetical protein
VSHFLSYSEGYTRAHQPTRHTIPGKVAYKGTRGSHRERHLHVPHVTCHADKARHPRACVSTTAARGTATAVIGTSSRSCPAREAFTGCAGCLRPAPNRHPASVNLPMWAVACGSRFFSMRRTTSSVPGGRPPRRRPACRALVLGDGLWRGGRTAHRGSAGQAEPALRRHHGDDRAAGQGVQRALWPRRGVTAHAQVSGPGHRMPAVLGDRRKALTQTGTCELSLH